MMARSRCGCRCWAPAWGGWGEGCVCVWTGVEGASALCYERVCLCLTRDALGPRANTRGVPPPPHAPPPPTYIVIK